MYGFCQRFSLALLGLLLAIAPSWRVQAQEKTDDDFIKTVTAKFFLWDQNHDQTLSLEELDAAIVDSGNRGQAAAALAALKRAARSTNYALPALTLANIRQLVEGPPAAHRPNLPELYRQCLKTISSVQRRQIFTASQLFPSGAPQLETVRQGKMGDCFCLAPFGAMIHRDPHEVASLYEVEADGHVMLRFGGGAVMVAPPTDAELALAMLAPDKHDVAWVNLYEKAMGQVRNSQKSPDKQSELAIDAIAKGGDAGKIMSYLTGHKVSGFSFKFGNDSATPVERRTAKLADLRQKLATATEQKRLMACWTKKTTTPGLTPGHAYALLEYSPQTDTVGLWNPHGNSFTPKGPPGLTYGYATKSGLFTVPVTEFVQQFAGALFEGAEIATRP